ncbi:ABC transporter ATP-binding protein [Pendulispora albinea]|uniref:ABC transporter ATP-binding protein n=1 Tax=Pendulispora albinea TaxID=2741071 RepID=A0ABZ2M520_9BACT
MTHAIEVEGVSKSYGSGQEQVRALVDAHLHIAPGEFVSLIGPSGCGKSTLLRLIADLATPTHGAIRIHGKSPHQARLDREFGMVFQSPVLYEWRTVLRNVLLPLEVMGVRADEARDRASAMLRLVGLSRFENHHPWQLSGGMQQRVAIARALVFQPPILMMDEPFGALDELTRERLNNELLNLWQKQAAPRKSTVLFVTHSIHEAVFLSSRVVVMSPRPGRIERIVDIDLPRPRTAEMRWAPRFLELVATVRQALREDDGASAHSRRETAHGAS